MKRIILLLVFAIFAVNVSQAKIWRINNNAGGISADTNTVQAGHDIASPGDTLHIEASANEYGSLNITKTLVIIGPGYFLGLNPETQANLLSGKIHNVTFNTGSSGTVIMGCELTGYLYINSSNILIMRNKMRRMNIGTGNDSYANIILKQNYCQFDGYWDGAFISYGSNTTVSNLIIKNNYIYQFNGNYQICNLGASFSGIFENNVVRNSSSLSGITLNNFIVKNNIFYEGSFTGINCSVLNNIGNVTQFPLINGNQQNVDMSTVFVLTGTSSTDGQWQLKPSSPAIGAGEGGVDCGMYGGVDPYILSGMPPVPAIYYYNTYGTGTQQTIKVKVKSHN